MLRCSLQDFHFISPFYLIAETLENAERRIKRGNITSLIPLPQKHCSSFILFPSYGPPKDCNINTDLVLFFFFFFFGPPLWHMEGPRPGVEWELYLLAYTTATARPDP